MFIALSSPYLNSLLLDGFKTFPQLTHMDLSFNQIKNLKLNINDYETLEVKSIHSLHHFFFTFFQELNLSYNNLTMHDIETLGMLPSLRVLHASGNDLVGLPRRLAKPYVHTDM